MGLLGKKPGGVLPFFRICLWALLAFFGDEAAFKNEWQAEPRYTDGGSLLKIVADPADSRKNEHTNEIRTIEYPTGY